MAFLAFMRTSDPVIARVVARMISSQIAYRISHRVQSTGVILSDGPIAVNEALRSVEQIGLFPLGASTSLPFIAAEVAELGSAWAAVNLIVRVLGLGVFVLMLFVA